MKTFIINSIGYSVYERKARSSPVCQCAALATEFPRARKRLRASDGAQKRAHGKARLWWRVAEVRAHGTRAAREAAVSRHSVPAELRTWSTQASSSNEPSRNGCTGQAERQGSSAQRSQGDERGGEEGRERLSRRDNPPRYACQRPYVSWIRSPMGLGWTGSQRRARR